MTAASQPKFALGHGSCAKPRPHVVRAAAHRDECARHTVHRWLASDDAFADHSLRAHRAPASP